MDDHYAQKLLLQIHWNDGALPADDDDAFGSSGTTKKRMPTLELLPRQRAGESALAFRLRCEAAFLRHIQTVSLADAVRMLEHQPQHFRRFAAIFSAIRTRTWHASTLTAFVRRLVLLPNFRRAPLRTALSQSFVALCMCHRAELGDVLLDVLTDRRPPAALVDRLFTKHRFMTVDFALVQRWAAETPYTLPFSGFFPPRTADAPQFSRVFAALARQSRLQFGRAELSSQLVDATLAHANDADCLLLARLHMRQNRVRCVGQLLFLTDEPRRNQFVLYGELSVTNKRRYEHLVIVETLFALAPLRLPVYVVVEMLSWLSPLLATNRGAWGRYTALATSILRAHDARSAAAIKTLPDAKRNKKP